MKTRNYLVGLSILSFGFNSYSQQNQHLIKEWEQNFGTNFSPNMADFEVDNNNNVIVLSNHTTGGQNEVKLSCVHPGGNTLWENTCNNTSDINQAIDIVLDNANNIYALYQKNDNNYVITKYAPQGNQIWYSEYNQANAKAQSIKLSNNALFVGGTIQGSSENVFISKVQTNNGNQQQTFLTNENTSSRLIDFNFQGSGNLVVLIKHSSNNESRHSILKINSNNLNQQSSLFLESSFGQNQANDLEIFGNFVLVAGKSEQNGNKGVIYGINSACNNVLVSYNCEKENSAYDKMKANGNNLFLAGSFIDDGTLKGLIQKADGTLQVGSEKIYEMPYSNSEMKVSDLEVNNENVAVLFEAKTNSTENKNWVIMSTDENLQTPNAFVLDKENKIDSPTKLSLQGNSIYAYGSTKQETSNNATIIKLAKENIVDIPEHEASERNIYNSFVKNYGQVTGYGNVSGAVKNVQYYSRQNQFTEFFTKDGIAFQNTRKIDSVNNRFDVNRIDLFFEGGSLENITPMEKGELKRNFFLGHTEKGIVGAEDYGSLFFTKLYNEIDLKYTHNDAGARIFFRVNPNGDYQNISLKWEGASSISLNNDGLVVANPINDFSFENPVAYQISEGVIQYFDIEYDLSDNVVKFKNLVNFNKSKPLYIYIGQGGNFPVQAKNQEDNMLWSTYFGEAEYSQAKDVVSDNFGNVYYTGDVEGNTALILTAGFFPIVSSAQSFDAYIVKFNENVEPQWYTYYGGSQSYGSNNAQTDVPSDITKAIDLNTSGTSIFITGWTKSVDLPVPHSGTEYFNPLGNFCNGPGNNNICKDYFISRFDNNGILQWATFYGGGSSEIPTDITVDLAGNFYVVGTRNSTTPLAPLSGATNYSTGNSLMLKFNAQNELEWANAWDGERYSGVATDRFNHVYGVGHTSSFDMPVLFNPLNTGTSSVTDASNGGIFDGFVNHFDENGVLQHSFYYGGDCGDYVKDIGIDDANQTVFIAGVTAYHTVGDFCGVDDHVGSLNLPVLGNGFPLPTGDVESHLNHFVAKFEKFTPNSNVEILDAGYFGGKGSEYELNTDWATKWTKVNLSVQKGGIFALSGATKSKNAPFNGVIQMPQFQPQGFFFQADRDQTGGNYAIDSYIAVFDENFNLKYSTYFGDGQQNEGPAGIDFGVDNRLWYAGNTKTFNTTDRPEEERLYVERFDNEITTDDYYKELISENNEQPSWFALFDMTGLDIPSSSGVGLNELQSEDVSIYPNPSSDLITINSDHLINKVRIIDVSGRLVYETRPFTQQLDVSLASFEKGAYITIIQTPTREVIKKIIKQ